MKIFVSGISTEVGKTVVSAIVTEALMADYWKPVQSGDLHNTDTMKVQNLVSNNETQFHPEAYRLTQPLSPHTSAEIDNVTIELDQIKIPSTKKDLVIEGAGGLLVPLNDSQTLLDMIETMNIPVILVSKNYLGSINHSLMSFEVLKARNIKVLGWVFNGPKNESGQKYITEYSQLPTLLELPELEKINEEEIKKYAGLFLQNFKEYLK